MSIYQRVTDAILAQLETADADAWICPWHNSMSGIPVNAVTGRRYRGINVISCWAAVRTADYGDRRWASYRQWTQIGGQVRKGERGTLCVFYKALQEGDRGHLLAQNGSPDADGGPRFVLRFSTIFNAGQVDGVEPERIDTPRSFDIAPVAAIESLIEQSGAIIREDVQASYVPSLDIIRMPPRETFRTAEGYCGTLAHELIHWTGAKPRLDRQLSDRFGSRSYAAEELVAELGAAFVQASVGLAARPHIDHARYLASWLPLVRSDPRALFTAAALAEKATEFLLNARLSACTLSEPVQGRADDDVPAAAE